MTDDGPGIRILSLVALLLDRRQPVTLTWIQEHMEGAYGPSELDARDDATRKAFEAGRRKFLRDQELLARLGLRIVYLQGGDDDEEAGYLLNADAFRTPELRLDASEAEVVRLAASLAGGVEGFPLGSDLALALAKLSALAAGLDLSPGDGHVAAAWSYRHSLAVRAPQLDAILPMVAEAVVERRRVRLWYRALQSEGETERLLDPWGLFLRRGVWHLVGWCHLRQDVRLFDAHRIRQARPEGPEDAFLPAPGFDLSAWARREPWELAMHAPMTVTLRLERTVAGLFHPGQGGARTLASAPDGGRTVAVVATNLDSLLGLVLSLWGRAVVLDPPEAVSAFDALVDRVLAAHAGEALP
jgi:proteasome accessory factor B